MSALKYRVEMYKYVITDIIIDDKSSHLNYRRV